MNKQDLVEALSTRLHKSQKEASDTIDALVDEIKKAIGKGEAIRISGFGAFEQTVRSARQGRNPRTGEPVKIAPTRVVRFRPAADFKAIVAGTRKAVAAAVPGGGEPAKPAEAPAAQKTAAKKAAVKKPVAKKATTRKTAAKKTSAATASAAKKSSAATKATVQKAMTPTTTTANKATAAKATPAKKTTAKKTTARKTTATKTTATKTAAPSE